VSSSLQKRLTDSVSGSPLAERISVAGEPFFERRSGDRAAAALDGPALVGLARVLASQHEVAGFLSHRPQLLERIAASQGDTLGQRAREIRRGVFREDKGDLESCLDEIRLFRREETCLAACLDLGHIVEFEAVSEFLSVLAESITQRSLDLARHSVDPAMPESAFSVIGMGKVAGREFTYHSDLDLIFLYDGSPEEIPRVSRIGQRLISYLTTMTGAGVAYAVDSRLRPSGQQGMLVTSYASFEQYQCEQAQTWEHLALLRARAIAGGIEAVEALLHHVRRTVLGSGSSPWAYLGDLRARVAGERAVESGAAIPIKTGRGGLMDIDFLAAGGVLERGADFVPDLPSIPRMFRSVAQGTTIDRLLADYLTLRTVEARCRWVHGRAIEALETQGDFLEVIAELVEPALTAGDLLERVAQVRARVRAAFDAVINAGAIAAIP